MKNLMETLNIKTISVAKTKVIISLEVSDAVRQPYGILHGGINSVMAETAASIGANENLVDEKHAVGINISTQHLLPVADGTIIATASPIHIGQTLQTWNVEITNKQKITSTSVVTLLNK